MKCKKKFLFFLLAILLLSPSVSAQTLSDEISDFADLDSLWESLPAEISREDLEALILPDDNGNALKKVFHALLTYFTLGLRDSLSFFACLCAILLLGAVAEALRGSFFKEGVYQGFRWFYLLFLSVTTYSALRDSLGIVQNAIQATHAFLLTSLPVSTVLLAMGGSVQSATLQSTQLRLILSLVSALISRFLFPLLKITFALETTGQITEIRLGGITAFLKKSVKVLCLFFYTVSSAVLGFRNALAAAGDSLAMRSVRFAAGSFIPVVGSLVGEASKTLAASLKMIRTECGVICIAVLLGILLPPILGIFIKKAMISMAAAFAELLNVENAKGYLHSLNGILDLMNALMICEGIYLIFHITLFLNTKGTLL